MNLEVRGTVSYAKMRVVYTTNLQSLVRETLKRLGNRVTYGHILCYLDILGYLDLYGKEVLLTDNRLESIK